MSHLIIILVCLLAGVLLRRLPQTAPQVHEGVNLFVLYVALPAVTLRQVSVMPLDWSMAGMLLVSVLVFVGAWGFFRLWRKGRAMDRATFGCLWLVCGLGNTSFLGFPLTSLYYGSEGLQQAILVDQGSFLVLATAGVWVAARFQPGAARPAARQMLVKILTFPQFPAFLLALLLRPYPLPEEILEVLDRLGATLVPLALFSVGLQLRIDEAAGRKRLLAVGLGYKMLAAPLMIWLMYVQMGLVKGLPGRVAVLEAAMAPMVTAAILATRYGLHPPLAQLLIGVGIPLSLLTTAIWAWYLG